jgi:hypothetical protein
MYLGKRRTADSLTPAYSVCLYLLETLCLFPSPYLAQEVAKGDGLPMAQQPLRGGGSANKYG